MKSKFNSVRKNILGTLILIALLVGVFYAMQYTRTLQFQSSLEILFNPEADRSWNWCPEGVSSIEVLNSDLRQEATTSSQICNVHIEAASELPDREFKPLLKAIAQKRTVTLESNAQLEIFRIEGLPFRSKALTEHLKSLTSEKE